MDISINRDSESEEEKDLLLHGSYQNSEQNSLEDSISNIVCLDQFADCPIIWWSTISDQYEEFLKSFDFSKTYEDLLNESSDSS